MQQYVTGTLAHKKLSAEELSSVREEYRKLSRIVNEINAHFLVSRSRLLVVEQQDNDWKEECRLIVNTGRGKDDKYEAEVVSLRTEVTAQS